MSNHQQTANSRVHTRATSGVPILWCLLLASTIPMLLVYFWGLWKLEHYQFFPLLLVFVVAMAYGRGQRPIAPPRGAAVIALIAIAMTCNFLSIALFSPWFAALAFVSLITAALHSIRDKDTAQRSLIILAVPLLSLVRLPLNLDQELILRLQQLTSGLSSWFLDLLLVPHQVDGNIIQMVDRDLFVAEACSGIQSVFTLICLAGVVLAFRRRPWWMVPVYWGAAILVAVVCNSLRVTIISGAAHLGLDWATGVSHTIVGHVALVLAFGFLLSFDQCVDLLIHPIQGLVFEADGWVNPLIRFWDDHVVGLPTCAGSCDGQGWLTQATARVGGDGGACQSDLTAAGKSPADSAPRDPAPVVPAPAVSVFNAQEAAAAVNHPSISGDWPNRIGTVDETRIGTVDETAGGRNGFYLLATLATGILIAATTMVVTVAISQSLPTGEPSGLFTVRTDFVRVPQDVLATGMTGPDLSGPDLCESAERWLRPVGYERVEDPQNPRLGQMADVWTLAGNNWQGQLVLSQAYNGWHELCICYSNLQWRLASREVIDPATIAGGLRLDESCRTGFVLARFERSQVQRGYLLFSAINYAGEIVAPPTSTGTLGQLRQRFAPQPAAPRPVPSSDGILMVQLWIESAQEFGPEEMLSAQQAFQIARTKLRAAIAQPAKAPASSPTSS